MEKGEIVLYQPDDSIRLEVRVDDDTVWLNRQQIKGIPTIANFATIQKEGDRWVNRNVDFYNLDMILSVGYRVKSQRGVDFRRWANKVLKDYILRGYAVNQRIERLEQRVSKTEEKIDFFVRTSLPPVEGVFFDGQIFDAYVFAADLIKSATKRGKKLFAFSKLGISKEVLL